MIWLDLPFSITSWRLFIRFLKRFLRGKRDNLKETLQLLKVAKEYRKKGYFEDKEVIERHKVNFVYIRTKKEMNKLLSDLK